MEEGIKTLSVSQAAALCDVGRTTVGYWIRSKKLAATRRGKKYEIPVQNLLYYLKANGQEIPAQLENENLSGPVFQSLQNCWQYHRDHSHGLNCPQCIVFKNKLPVCFSARNDGKLNCTGGCQKCRYYREAYYPRVQFIYQFEIPAAIIKDLNFWAGNPAMADLCQVGQKHLVGMGIEKIIHPRSLEQVISCAKRKALGDAGTQSECRIYIKNHQADGLKIKCSVFVLKQPPGAFLITAAPDLSDLPHFQYQALNKSGEELAQ
ncbi:MAG: helix-turn-helix domain-containing protein [Desulfobacterales bacterium]|jgi:excisionase family DNA binding protein